MVAFLVFVCSIHFAMYFPFPQALLVMNWSVIYCLNFAPSQKSSFISKTPLISENTFDLASYLLFPVALTMAVTLLSLNCRYCILFEIVMVTSGFIRFVFFSFVLFCFYTCFLFKAK